MKISELKQLYNKLNTKNNMHGGHIPSAKEKHAIEMLTKGVNDLMEITMRPFGVKHVYELQMRERLALSARTIAAFGHSGGLAGQYTARGPTPNTMWTQKFGIAMEELTSDDFLLVNENLKVIEGDGIPNPANVFHLAAYRKRPDVMSIVHTHSFNCAALSMRGEPLMIAHMDTCPIYDDCAFLSSWPGIPFGFDEGELIANTLGDKKAAILANHGFLATGKTIEEAAYIAIIIEHAAKLQLVACGGKDATERLHPVHDNMGKEANDFFSKEAVILSNWCYYARCALKEFPDFNPLLTEKLALDKEVSSQSNSNSTVETASNKSSDILERILD